jgi:type II secretory pathway pseudopilin PulG
MLYFKQKKNILNFTLLELLMVIVIVSFMMLMVMASFQEMTKGQAVNIATRNLAGKMILARSFAINNRQYVAILIPQCGGYPSSGVPSQYYNRSYRACIVGKNGSNYYFKRWIPGENWDFTPTGIAILEVDSDEGVSTTSGKLTPANTSPTTVSPLPLPALPPNRGINCSDIGGDSAVTGCAAIVFKPSGKSTGAKYIEIGEGVYSGGSVSLIMTNPSPNAYLTINIHQHTGRVAYEKGP